MNLIKEILCKHKNQICLTNCYGDFILHVSTRKQITRSIWKCHDCGKVFLKPTLDPNCKYTNFHKK